MRHVLWEDDSSLRAEDGAGPEVPLDPVWVHVQGVGPGHMDVHMAAAWR